MEETDKMKCPKCGKELDVDSVRKHKSGRKRIYWECEECDLSVMHRGQK